MKWVENGQQESRRIPKGDSWEGDLQRCETLALRCGVFERTDADRGGALEREETLQTDDGWDTEWGLDDVVPRKDRRRNSPVRTPQAGCQSSS